MTDEAWEALCKRCGRCCFEKWIEEDGTVVETTTPCRFLDVATRRCKVYHKRFETGEDCIKLTPEVVRGAFWLPRECGYVEWLDRVTGCQQFEDEVSKRGRDRAISRPRGRRKRR